MSRVDLFYSFGSNLKLIHLIQPFLDHHTMMMLTRLNRGYLFFKSVVIADRFWGLVKIKLENLGLVHIGGELGILDHLKTLKLTGNKITQLPDAWAYEGAMPALVKLEVGHNSITHLPTSWGSVRAFRRLKTLRLDYNRIRTLPPAWGSAGAFRSLYTLDLGSNDIEVVPECWGYDGVFGQLGRLCIDCNKLSSLPKTWTAKQALPNLEILYVSGNDLYHVSAKLLLKWTVYCDRRR